MNILGINGLGNIPAAAILCNGKLIAFAEEERFTRIKGSDGIMPSNSVKYCLSEAGLNIRDIDAIAFGWDANKYLYTMPLFYLGKFLSNFKLNNKSSNFKAVAQQLIKYNPIRVKSELKKMIDFDSHLHKTPPIHFVDHHLAHAASTFYASGFNESLVLVVDGSGEINSTSIYYGNSSSIILLKSFQIPNSIGWFYQSITEFLGFKPNSHEGKLMALAAYGEKDSDIYNKINQMIYSDDLGNYQYNAEYSYTGHHKNGKVFSTKTEDLLGPSRTTEDPILQYHKNIAFATQQITEDIILKIVKKELNQIKSETNICIAGGVGLNCKLNGKISALPGIKNIFVPPHCHDAGTALGAAMLIAESNGDYPKFKMTHAYWGPEYNELNIQEVLVKNKLSYTEYEEIAKISAQLLSEGKIIAWFQGRMEVGARALGNRSILANPIQPITRDYINQSIKSRELWRPFAASILEPYQETYLINSKKSLFMTLAYDVTEEFSNSAPSAIHIDKTTRPQIVSKEENALYYQLIEYFGNITGVYALLNTSFNLKEEPVVCSPNDAIKTLLNSEIDYLAIGNFLVPNPKKTV